VDALARAQEIDWYHCMELAPGHVTDGVFDLRTYIDGYGLPENMQGMRALDVGTFDGFWAFEMERRGAEVVALDLRFESELDWPPRRRQEADSSTPRGEGFRLAREIFGSSVERIERNLYEATPSELGTFDLVFCGSVLIHVRDQLLALERIAGLCRDRFISAEPYDRLTSLLPISVARYRPDRPKSVVFWEPSIRTWRRMIWTAGFDQVESFNRFRLRSTHGYSVPHVVLHARRQPG